MTAFRKRHRWGEPVRFEHKSERICENGCGLIRVTRHEGREHWIEFWREGATTHIDCDRTPKCEPISVSTLPAGRPASMEA